MFKYNIIFIAIITLHFKTEASLERKAQLVSDPNAQPNIQPDSAMITLPTVPPEGASEEEEASQEYGLPSAEVSIVPISCQGSRSSTPCVLTTANPLISKDSQVSYVAPGYPMPRRSDDARGSKVAEDAVAAQE